MVEQERGNEPGIKTVIARTSSNIISSKLEAPETKKRRLAADRLQQQAMEELTDLLANKPGALSMLEELQNGRKI